MKQPSRLQAVVEYVLDNVFDVATIVIASYLVIRHQVRPFTANDIVELATWILGVLGLIAVSGLWERNRRLHRIEKMVEESRDIVRRRESGRVRAEDFFLLEQSLPKETLNTAMTVLLAGVTLTRTCRNLMHVLSQRLVAGAHIRVIMVDPTVESVLQELVLRRNMVITGEHLRNDVQATRAIVETIATTPRNNGRIEIGYLPYIPSFGLTIVDPDEPHGFCSVEIYHHRSAEPKASFQLLASNDPYWYAFFRRQYEILWNSCRIEQFPAPPVPETKKRDGVTSET